MNLSEAMPMPASASPSVVPAVPACDVIIINWNAGQQLADCLQALSRCDKSGFTLNRVVVVDNASTDTSLEDAESLTLDFPLAVIRNSQNRGFAAACNQGAKESTADYLLFLNPDAVVFSDSLSTSIAFLEKPEAAKIGIVGIPLVDDSDLPTRNSCRFPTPGLFFRELLGLNYLFPKRFPGHVNLDWGHNENRAVDHVIGAFYLVRHSVFQALDGFDERFFVYKEDLDFSLRAFQAGWSSYFLAETRAYHRGGGSSEQIKAKRLFFGLRSRVQYGFKHFSWPAAFGLLLATLFLEPVARVARAILMRSAETFWETLGGMGQLWLWAVSRPSKHERTKELSTNGDYKYY
jgi:N-acetylglucosaminyl-diphospho-decaprenol L-rhamnosyltransferase